MTNTEPRIAESETHLNTARLLTESAWDSSIRLQLSEGHRFGITPDTVIREINEAIDALQLARAAIRGVSL